MNSEGEYQLLKPLGVGGMAETFLALRQRADGFEQHVCLKRILPAFARDPLYRKLFVEEARLAARLRHSNIVGVIDYTSSSQELYLVFELIAGCDLRSILRSQPGRKLTPQLSILIATELAQGLRHAHGKGIVHRDLSPSNVLISIDGEVKLADFGIAKAMNAATHSGSVKGKIPYMAPEQARAIKVDGRADLFSLGVMMYQCLLGHRPFDGSSEVETLTRVLESKFTRMREVDHADIPDALSEIVDTLLAHEREDRFPNAGDLLQRLYGLTPGPDAREALGALAREIYDPTKLTTDPGEALGEAADKVLAVEVAHSLKSTLEDQAPVVDGPVVDITVPQVDALQVVPEIDGPEPALKGAVTQTKDRSAESLAPVQALGANAVTPLEGPTSRNPALRRRAVFAIGVGALFGIGAMVLSSPKVAEVSTQHDAALSDRGGDHVTPATNPPTTNPPATNPQAPTTEARSSQEEDPSIGTSDALVTAHEGGPEQDPEQAAPENAVEAGVVEGAAAGDATEGAAEAIEPANMVVSAEERGTLTVVVLPFGDVWVDGRHVGSTPARVRLRPGVHSIEAGTESDRVRRSIRLEPGQRRHVTINRARQ